MRVAVSIVLVILLVVAAAFLARPSRPQIPFIMPPAAGAFDPGLVTRGAQLAAIGNCNVCHTAAGGQIFAGGLAMPTPFGTIYSTNITPDAQTGIGRWSEPAFQRAMREGIDREGRHLYPAFPYDHFTQVTDEDNRALYAYLMTRAPIRATAPRNRLWFPLNIRAVVAGWKRLFFKEGPYIADPAQSAEWNRGAYLVEGLGHCGACHTPRNALGAERRDQAYAGGEAEGWNAYALDRSSPSPLPWSVEQLAYFLRAGWHPEHGVARGPMAPVTANLESVPESDVQAMATYIFSRMGTRLPTPLPKGRAAAGAGADIYAASCAGCHDGSRPLPFGGIDLKLSTAVNAPNPRNIINVTLQGLPAADGRQSAIMPGLDGAISNEQLGELLGYLRSRFSDKPAWSGVGGEIRAARREQDSGGGS